MSNKVWEALRQAVYRRAKGCCEYCLTSEENSGQTMQIDHIDPNGDDTLENLCLACWSCNNFKRKATSVIDTASGESVSLYNPRTHQWAEHFIWADNSTRIIGITACGRATVARLKMNRSAIVVARYRWVEAGYHPPSN